MTTSRLLQGSLLLVVLVGCGGSGGASFSPTPEELCGALVACTPPTTLESCLASSRPELDEASTLGCVAEANAANACTVRSLAGDGGTCDTTTLPTRCADEYAAYRTCIVENGGGGGDRACYVNTTALHSCTTYPDGFDISMVCASQMGTAMASCPAGERLGRCTLGAAPNASTIEYYTPSVLTAEQYESICTMNGGTWSAP